MTFAAILCCTLTTAVLTACTNSDNSVIESDGITLNTAALYNELNTTADMNTFLADSKNRVYATVLIYDKQGSLIEQFTKETHTLHPLTFDVEGIADGTYTLVAFQSAAGEESVWSLADAERLSDVHVAIADRTLLPVEVALGIASKTIRISGGTCRAKISPKSVGSIVETRAMGYTAADDAKALSLAYFADIRGVYLSPDRTADDRLDLVGTSEHRFCQVGDKKAVLEGDIVWKGFSLYTGQDVDLMLCKYDPETNLFNVLTQARVDMKPGGNYVFYFDNNALQLLRTFAGTQQGLDQWLDNRNANPLQVKPYIEFGSSLSSVVDYMKKNYGWWCSLPTDYSLTFSEDYGLWVIRYYSGMLFMDYCFNNQDGQELFYCQYVNYDSNISIDDMKAQLVSQGYTYKGIFNYPNVDEQSKYYYYQSADEKLEVTLIDWADGTWSVTFQLPDPNDLQYLVPAE